MLQPLLTRLDELDKLATQGEWQDPYYSMGYPVDKIGSSGIFSREAMINGRTGMLANMSSCLDAAFIRLLRNAYPILRAEIERLQEVERKYNETVTTCHDLK